MFTKGKTISTCMPTYNLLPNAVESYIQGEGVGLCTVSTRTVIDKEFLPIRLSIRKLPIWYYDSIRIDKNLNYL